MSQLGHERLGGASCRSSNVRNTPLATVGLKKAACREGPKASFCFAANSECSCDDCHEILQRLFNSIQPHLAEADISFCAARRAMEGF